LINDKREEQFTLEILRIFSRIVMESTVQQYL